MPEDRKMANRFNKSWTNDGDRIPRRIFAKVLLVVVPLIVGLGPNGYFLSAVVFFGISLNAVVDDVRRSCFLADSGVGALGFSGAMESP